MMMVMMMMIKLSVSSSFVKWKPHTDHQKLREREYLFATAAVGQKGQCPSMLATKQEKCRNTEIQVQHNRLHMPNWARRVDLKNFRVRLWESECLADALLMCYWSRCHLCWSTGDKTTNTAVIIIEGECTQFNLQILLLQRIYFVCTLRLESMPNTRNHVNNWTILQRCRSQLQLASSHWREWVGRFLTAWSESNKYVLHYVRRFIVGLIAVK